jgi:D-alanine-D-alanine ligase
VEEGLDAREIECAVIGNDEPEASLPGEYIVHDQQGAFLDYTEKYSNTGHVEFVVPAPVSKSLAARIRRMAIAAFKSIDGAGTGARGLLSPAHDGRTLRQRTQHQPGLTEVSGYPKLWAASGLSFAQVIDRLIELALERHRDKSRNETSL